MVSHVASPGCTPLPYKSPTSDPTPSTGVATGRPTACPAPKELVTYIVDLISSCLRAQHVSILRGGV
jgi:hypothetical protein